MCLHIPVLHIAPHIADATYPLTSALGSIGAVIRCVFLTENLYSHLRNVLEFSPLTFSFNIYIA